MRARALALAALAAWAVGCGDGERQPLLRVSAAASLKAAFAEYGRTLADARATFSFAGSDELAAQIRQGGRPDVFASADTRLAASLYSAGLVERPVVFASSRVALAVPASGGPVASLADAGRPGVRVAIGANGVPVGDYARAALTRLDAGTARAVGANVRTEEPDVAGIVAKLTQGAVDAGFVYVTDVAAAGGRLRAIELPAAARARVAYAAAVVKGARHPTEARAFVTGLLTGPGVRVLRAAGFGPPPS